VPYSSLGPDEAVGILNLLRTANNRALGILEQAAFIAELKNTRQMSVAQIALELSRSKSWVSMRLDFMAEMSAPVRRQLFAGAFPVYSYMYALRSVHAPWNGVKPAQIEEFVLAVSGKGLSVREGGAISPRLLPGTGVLSSGNLKGNLALPLERMRQVPQSSDGCNEFERSCSATWN